MSTVATGARCSACGGEVPAAFRFCGHCGTAVAAPPDARPTEDAERRHLTVLFCDLVGSTALSERLDAETLRTVIREYQSACTETIARFEGYVAQYLGDGILVYFGYPTAHEDDARRAVYAGLGLIQAVGALNLRLEREHQVRLSVRVGIHTGEVVAGEVGAGQSRERLALGRAPNVAARIEGIAPPDSVVISDATFALVRGFFVCESMGPTTLKGMSQPVEPFRVAGETNVRSAFEAAVAGGLTPMVGRATEVDLLLDGFARTSEGTGHVVLVSGEAGIGKSRLIHRFQEQLGARPHHWLLARCSPYDQQSALNPVIELLKASFELRPDDPPPQRLHRIAQGLEPFERSLDEVVPLVADLLSVPLDHEYAPLGLSPQRRKEKTLDWLVGFCAKLAVQKPVVFVVEDLHWVDPSTLELLTLLINQVPGTRLLLCLTLRPTFTPPWDAPLTRIELDRLPEPEIDALAARVAGGRQLPDQLMQLIRTRTDGVPLFVEEMTKMLLESGLLRDGGDGLEAAGPLPSLAIPTTLQDSLAARLDRMGDARQVAQLASVIGREFSYGMLEALAGNGESALRGALTRLVAAELVYQRGVPPRERYVFKHALIRDAAYESLLKSTRQQHHARLGHVMTERFPETAETRPDLVGHHYTEAGLHEPAVGFWLKAGQRAIGRAANTEAVGYVTRGLASLAELPASAARDAQELALQMALGGALMASKGYAAPEVERPFARAHQLSEQMGSAPQLFRVLDGLGMFHSARAEYHRAADLGRRMLDLANATGHPGFAIQARYRVGLSHFYLGEFSAARAEFEQGDALDTPDLDRSLVVSPLGDDLRVYLKSFLGLTVWHLGYPDLALRHADAAVRLAREIAHPYGVTWAVNLAGWVHHFRGEPGPTGELAKEGLVIARDKGFSFWIGLGGCLFGWALAQGPAVAEGIAYMERSLTGYRASGARLGQTLLLSCLAETYVRQKRFTDARALLDESLRAIDETDERAWEAEFHRMRAELLLLEGGNGHSSAESKRHAEREYRQAIAVAARQEARSLELRAALGLARLRGTLLDGRPAHARLRELHGEFDEGLDTPDLRGAATLLAELT